MTHTDTHPLPASSDTTACTPYKTQPNEQSHTLISLHFLRIAAADSAGEEGKEHHHETGGDSGLAGGTRVQRTPECVFATEGEKIRLVNFFKRPLHPTPPHIVGPGPRSDK